jgi:amino acid permease
LVSVNRSGVDKCSPLEAKDVNVLPPPSTMASSSNQDYGVAAARWDDSEQGKKELAEVDMRGVSPSEHNIVSETLARKLSARQVQMIAIGGEYTTAYLLAIHSTSTLTKR